MIEDNHGDVLLTKEALRDAPVKLHVLEDGSNAMEFLHRQGRYAHQNKPDLVILDLNLPKKSGREILTEMKAHPDLRRIPVVILTTSDSDEDVIEAYNMQVNCYISKPVDYENFVRVIRAIETFWFKTAALPTR